MNAPGKSNPDGFLQILRELIGLTVPALVGYWVRTLVINRKTRLRRESEDTTTLANKQTALVQATVANEVALAEMNIEWAQKLMDRIEGQYTTMLTNNNRQMESMAERIKALEDLVEHWREQHAKCHAEILANRVEIDKLKRDIVLLSPTQPPPPAGIRTDGP